MYKHIHTGLYVCTHTYTHVHTTEDVYSKRYLPPWTYEGTNKSLEQAKEDLLSVIKDMKGATIIKTTDNVSLLLVTIFSYFARNHCPSLPSVYVSVIFFCRKCSLCDTDKPHTPSS